MSRSKSPYGVGLAYRIALHDEILKRESEIDLLEIPTEDYLVRQRRVWTDPDGRRLRTMMDRFPCVAHGISLSLGSVEPLDAAYVEGTRRFVDEAGIEVFSEHLAYHRLDGLDLTIFLCMPFDDLSLDWIAQNYRAASAAIGRPIALENVSYNFPVPGGGYTEPEFLAAVLERTGGTLLLDVTNVFNNCTNHGSDPYEYIRRLPGDRISQMHLAGGHYDDGFLIDSHSYPVMDEVWDLYEAALRHTAANIVIVERDENFKPYKALFDDVRRARELFFRHRPSRAPQSPTIEVSAGSNGNEQTADPLAPEFANLRNFQRAVLRAITDSEFARQAASDPEVVRREYPLDDQWLSRWSGLPRPALDRLARRWQWFQREDQKALNEYRRIEWRQWAQWLSGS